MIAHLKALWARLRASSAAADPATGIMRWPRPVGVVLIVLMFTVGWREPDHFKAFADAMSALPAHLWDVVMLLLSSIAATKVIRDLRG